MNILTKLNKPYVMEKFIKYKRIETSDVDNIQNIFDEIVKDGFEIIYYNEMYDNATPPKIKIVIVFGRRQVQQKMTL